MNNIQQFEAINLLHLLSANFPESSIAKISLSLVPYIIIFLIFCLVLWVLRKLISLKMFLDEKQIILEITPPKFIEKEAYTTEQLFTLIHALGKQRPFKDKLVGKKAQFSLEIVSTKNEGIRFLIKTSPQKANTLRKMLISYLPQIIIKTVDDYLSMIENINVNEKRIVEYKLTNHFAYPLKKQNFLDKHDPISYITGMMTKLNSNELVSLQIILCPVELNETKKIAKFILKNGDVLHYLNSKKILRLLSRGPIRNIERQSNSEKNIIESIEEKIKQPLFNTSLRLLLISDSKEDISERLSGMSSSFTSFSASDYQSITFRKYLNLKILNKLLFFSFKKRISILSKSFLSVSEVSSIYHFPFANTVSAEDLVKAHSKTLPAPLSLKQNRNYDVVLGRNNYGGTINDIGLTEEERETHMYIIGRTGSGKTTMIFSMAKDDIQKGRGVCVIDPHGDLAESLLNIVPTKRINDVIYFNPFDLKYPIGINLLELGENLEDDELELEKELVCESVISVFRRIFSKEESTNAHRIEYILRNTIYTSFAVPDRTFFTLYKLLTNKNYREGVVKTLDDQDLKDFWNNEFGKASNWQIVKMISGVTAKIGRFMYSPITKRIIDQPKSTINFDQIIDEGKILICNLSEGKIGEDTTQLLGLTIIAKIHQATLRRSRIEESKRTPFYLFVDEFQNFATTSFTRMLSGGRKFGLRLTLAEQSSAQQQDKNVVNVILANTGTVICFATASPQDEQMMESQFAPLITRGDLANLPKYQFYIKKSATYPEEPFSGETLLIDDIKDIRKIEKIIEASRKNYATVYVKPQKGKIKETVKTDTQKVIKKTQPKRFIPDEKEE